MSTTARLATVGSKTTSSHLSPRGKRAHANAFMVNSIAYSGLGYCAAKRYVLPAGSVLLLAPLISMWLLASRHRVNSRHVLVGGLTSAAVALIPTLAVSLAPAVKSFLLGPLLAQSLLMFVLLTACSILAHGCGTALAEGWPVRFNGGSRRRRHAGAHPAKSWQGLAAFCDAIEPILEKVVPAIVKAVITCLAWGLIRWLCG